LVVLAWLSLAKAQDKKCLADYIVTKCLTSEASKAQDSPTTDYDFFSSAYEVIATCYIKYPVDLRAPTARNQVSA
ncbi:hypothetical protein K457DRAFT_43630, partial [Linnemannia elongata AG-77]